MEWLESRVVLSNYMVTSTAYSPTTAGTLAYEIGAAITADDGAAVIGFDSSLAGQTISLNTSDTSATIAYGPTAFVISGTGVNITIDGSAAPGLTIDGGYDVDPADAIRPFAVESGSSLTLDNVTVSGGLRRGSLGAAARAAAAAVVARGWGVRSTMTEAHSRLTASPSPITSLEAVAAEPRMEGVLPMVDRAGRSEILRVVPAGARTKGPEWRAVLVGSALGEAEAGLTKLPASPALVDSAASAVAVAVAAPAVGRTGGGRGLRRRRWLPGRYFPGRQWRRWWWRRRPGGWNLQQ